MTINIGDSFSIYFSTNRNMEGRLTDPRFGGRTHKDGPEFYRVGVATVCKISDDLDKGYEINDVKIKGEGVTNPQNRGSDKLFAEIREDIRGRSCDALVYVHGFANSFESSISRAAQLHELYEIDHQDRSKHPVVFAFSWPSNGQTFPPWEYFSDRDDAEASGTAMARAVLRFSDYMRRTDDPCAQRIHLVAHSMGNWALRYAVQKLKLHAKERSLEPLFDNALLMAADEDDDALEKEHKLKPLLELARRIHVYHSNDDKALVISDTTKFNPDRLGYDGPRSFSGMSTRVVAIDCEAVDDTEFLHVNHQYYRRRPEVIADVKQVLTGVRPSNVIGRQVIEPGRRYRIQRNGQGSRLDTPQVPDGPAYAPHN